MATDQARLVAESPARPSHRPREVAVRTRTPEPPEPVAAYCLVAVLFGPGVLLWAAGLSVLACGLGTWPGLGLSSGGAGLLALGSLILGSLCRRPG